MNMKGMPFTKIVATIGPASWDEDVFRKLVANGLQVARINTPFADAAEIARVTSMVRSVSPRVAVLLDIMGHQVRITKHTTELILEEGNIIKFATVDKKHDGTDILQVTYPHFARDVIKDVRILIDDGNLQLVSEGANENGVVSARVLIGGKLDSNKTVNLPDIHLDFGDLTEKDKADIQSGIDNGVDMFATSFVRNKHDIELFRSALGDYPAKIIAKIEDREGVEHTDEILDVVDGVMIARGDLGVEEPMEKVPLYQKMFLKKCRERGKIVIVATQMMESMRENHRPTRAEVNDVASAIMDGTDCVMLSAESSVGKYPVEAVSMMSKIAIEVEPMLKPQIIKGKTSASVLTDTLTSHVPNIIEDLGLSAVIMITKTGKSVASLSRHRLRVPIYAVSTNPQLIRQIQAYRGVFGIYMKDLPSDRDLGIAKVVDAVYGSGALEFTDKIAVMSGSFTKNKKLTSILELVDVGDVLKHWNIG
jgi:pyruvate kinase